MERRKFCLYLVCLHLLGVSLLANCENIGIATSSAKNELPINNNTVLNTTMTLQQILNTTGIKANVHKNRTISPTNFNIITNESGAAVEINVGKTKSVAEHSEPNAVSNNPNITKYDNNLFVQKDNGTHGVNSLNSTDHSDYTNSTAKIKPEILLPTKQGNDSVVILNKTKDERSTTKSTTTTTTTTTTSTSTSTTTTTTTTTTTPKPKKPSITFGLADFPVLPGESNIINKVSESSSSKFPIPNDSVAPPNAEPSQELNSGFNYRSGRDYIVPVMTVLFTIPLAIGVVITTYRRFRDCWSTRHYRRMDFLVDGMYND